MGQRFLMHLLLLLLAFSFIIPPLYADDTLLDETQGLPFKYFFGNEPLEKGSELQLSGQNNADTQQLLIFRLDNANSSNYRSRVNQEYSLPKGEFNLSIPLTGLKTSGGDLLTQPYGEMIIFAGDDTDVLSLNEVRITTPQTLPKNTLALDFGHETSPVFPGFQQIHKDDSRIKGTLLTRFRKSGDALIQDGIEGIDAVSIPWPNGQWKLSLWTRDQGEWEYLPHYLNRKITAENVEVLHEVHSREQWIKQVYLAGINKEADIDGDLWQVVGQRRSGFITQLVRVNDGVLNLTLEGDRAARYLAALVIEPFSGEFAENTEQQRRQRFLNQWPVATPAYNQVDQLTITDISQQIKDHSENSYLAAGGTLLNLVFEINSPAADSNPVIAIAPPRSGNNRKLNIATRYGHWRYERPQPNASSLILSDSFLRGDLSTMPLSNKRPRRIHIQVNIPVDASPGEYRGSIQLFTNGELYLQDYQIEVLPFTLPRLTAPIGLYLEPAPYYQWFTPLKKREAFATACDLSLLATMGFTSLAPSLVTPGNDENQQIFIQQLKQLKRFGFDSPVLAYASLKRLLAMSSARNTGIALLKLKQTLAEQELPEVFWSIFDEPVPEKLAAIQASSQLLHKSPLELKTAGHFNNPHQKDLVQAADLRIINHGYGVNENSIRAMKEDGMLWLYNMPNPRLAAGAYLWRSGADGYIQWHGRMPTADPFDPTDGREGDVIYLYPWQESCPSAISIHSRLLDLHEATLDYRWLHWLTTQASDHPQAGKLVEEFQAMIPTDWQKASTLTSQQLISMRQKIMEFILFKMK